MVTARLVIAGAHSGVGKTTVATGLMAALHGRGLRVAPFKVGPDFIDPSYHALATGRPGRNLDAFLCGPDLIGPLFAHGAAGADIAVIEGVMGLFDGAAARGELASTAQVARLLDAPVVLVVDASALSRSVAALVHGFDSFDPELRVRGVVLNRVGSDAHEAMLREALAPLRIPVLGVLRRREGLATPSRHLGLVPAVERVRQARETIDALAEAVRAGCDLDALLSIARSAGDLPSRPWSTAVRGGRPVRVALASGPAFSFRYQENLELLEAAGAELAAFDPTADERLPDGTAALYLGGGFPETYADELAANAPLRADIRAFSAGGGPVVAECGGLLYLCRSLDGRPMCAVLPADARMTTRLTLGYRSAVASVDSPLAAAGTSARGHEFHYSAVEPAAGAAPAWHLDRRGAIGDEGFVQAGVHASYLHIHWAATPQVAERLVASARQAAS